MYQYRYGLPLYKRKNGSTVIEHADYYDENIFDYYITSASQGDVQLGFSIMTEPNSILFRTITAAAVFCHIGLQVCI